MLAKTKSPLVVLIQVDEIWYYYQFLSNLQILGGNTPASVIFPKTTDQLPEGNTNKYFQAGYYINDTRFNNTVANVNTLIIEYNNLLTALNNFNVVAAANNLPLFVNLPNPITPITI